MTRIVPERSFALIGALLVSLWASPSRAQLTVEWRAPATCPGGAAVRAEVIRLLGGRLPEQLHLEAHAVAAQTAGTWTLSLSTEMDGAQGARWIEGSRCEQLADAAALILALMIDPEAVAEQAEADAEADAEAEGSIDSSASPRIAVSQLSSPEARAAAVGSSSEERWVTERPSSERSSRRRGGAVSRVVEHRSTSDDAPSRGAGETFDGFVGIGGALDVGSVPSLSGGLTLEGGFGIPLVDARVRATFVFGQEASRDAGSGALITSGMIDARVCVHPFDEARLVYGCLGLGLGLAVAEGFGLSGPETGVGTYAAAVAGVGVAWTLASWFDLALDVTLLVPFNPLEFAVRGSTDDVFHEQEPVAGRLGLAAHVRF